MNGEVQIDGQLIDPEPFEWQGAFVLEPESLYHLDQSDIHFLFGKSSPDTHPWSESEGQNDERISPFFPLFPQPPLRLVAEGILEVFVTLGRVFVFDEAAGAFGDAVSFDDDISSDGADVQRNDRPDSMRLL